MQRSIMLCAAAIGLTVLLPGLGAAIAADCSEGFFKSNVTGTPGQPGSSYTCTTNVIECPPPAAVTTVVALGNRKAMTPKYNEAKFSYTCTYNPPIH